MLIAVVEGILLGLVPLKNHWMCKSNNALVWNPYTFLSKFILL